MVPRSWLVLGGLATTAGIALCAPACEWAQSVPHDGPGAMTAVSCKSASECSAGLVCFLGHCATPPRPCQHGACTYPALFACAEGILTRCDGCNSDVGCVSRSACRSVDGGTCTIAPPASDGRDD